MGDIYIVRHGPTHARCLVGWSDLPADLSDRAALERLDAYLPADAVMVSSDLVRAAATADALQGTRHRLAHEPGLREMHFGDWELRHNDDLMQDAPDHLSAFWERPGEVRPPGGESWQDLVARVSTTLDRAAAMAGDRPLVAVAHMGVIMTQLAHALGAPPEDVFQQPIDPLSVTRFRRVGMRLDVFEINHRP